MSKYIEEKLKEFDRELVEMNLFKGRDMYNRPPLYDTPDEKIEEIKQFIKQALQEQEERIKQEMKEKIEKGIGVLISSSKVEEYEKDIMFNTGKGCGLNFGISILNKLLKELNI